MLRKKTNFNIKFDPQHDYSSLGWIPKINNALSITIYNLHLSLILFKISMY